MPDSTGGEGSSNDDGYDSDPEEQTSDDKLMMGRITSSASESKINRKKGRQRTTNSPALERPHTIKREQNVIRPASADAVPATPNIHVKLIRSDQHDISKIADIDFSITSPASARGHYPSTEDRPSSPELGTSPPEKSKEGFFSHITEKLAKYKNK
jgi:hypothetical protein